MREAVKDAIREAVAVPAHIRIAAAACAADLMHGPRFARLPEGGWNNLTEDDVSPVASDLQDDVSQVYTGPVGDMLREFISEIPTVYVDEDDCAHTSEPTAEDPEDGEDPVEPPIYAEIDSQAVVEALLGRTIATEFR